MKTLLTIAFVAAALGLISSIALFIHLVFYKKRAVNMKTINKK